MNGEDVAQKLQLIATQLRESKNDAMSLVNTPNFRELEMIWLTNRKAMYSKYYDMFKSYSPNGPFHNRINRSRVI